MSSRAKPNTLKQHLADPVLSLVEHCRHRWVALGAACADEPEPQSAEYAQWALNHQIAMDDWGHSFKRMSTTIPQTAVGAAAMIELFLETERPSLDHRTTTILHTLRQFLSVAAGCAGSNQQRSQ
jgi:hypothetical protein